MKSKEKTEPLLTHKHKTLFMHFFHQHLIVGKKAILGQKAEKIVFLSKNVDTLSDDV